MKSGLKRAPPIGREATENALLDAFETMLQRDGLRNLSLNAVVAAAGVGKPLLYRYFGDLNGLARAWAGRRGFWPQLTDEHGPASRLESDEAAFRRQIVEELVGNANYLRSNPVALEFLAEELTADSELSSAFDEARRKHRRPFVRTMLNDRRYLRRGNYRLIVILNAALVYLAMRSRRSPNFMGLRLDTEAGWRNVLDMVRELAALAEADDPDATAAPPKRRRQRRS